MSAVRTPGKWDSEVTTEHGYTTTSILVKGLKPYESDNQAEWPNDGFDLAQCHGPQQKENAAFIVLACNSHDGLLAALELVRQQNKALRGALQEAIDAGTDKLPVRKWGKVLADSCAGWKSIDAAIARATSQPEGGAA